MCRILLGTHKIFAAKVRWPWRKPFDEFNPVPWDCPAWAGLVEVNVYSKRNPLTKTSLTMPRLQHSRSRSCCFALPWWTSQAEKANMAHLGTHKSASAVTGLSWLPQLNPKKMVEKVSLYFSSLETDLGSRCAQAATDFTQVRYWTWRC